MGDRLPSCRFCGEKLGHTFADLGETPLANSFVTPEDAAAGRDRRYRLHARLCASCFLVQVDDSVPPEAIFSDYAYLSSYSDSWVEHARRYAHAMQKRFGLGPDSLVVEVASNDGYLLQHFLALGVPVHGIEPAQNAARVAMAKGIATEVAFFGAATAKRLIERGVRADLTVANNVLAHAPAILDFTRGFAAILKPEGVATFEFPHVQRLIEEALFDTIYHEHFFYLSLLAVERVFDAAELRVFDVEELPTHGGSLRVYACRAGASHRETEGVDAMRRKERRARLHQLAGYQGLEPRIAAVKRDFLAFLERARREGRSVAAYGAAAKGNTFLGYCGVTSADLRCVYDRSREKQGRLLPGSHLPILPPERIRELEPDYLVILPWNLAGEISTTMAEIRRWGGRFVVAVPRLRIF